MKNTIYIYTDVVSSQLGGLGGLCDCAVILQFHAFDWRPTTKSTKFMSLARFSQIQPGCWDARKALTCVNVQTKGAVETEKTKIENQNKHRKHEFARRLNIELLSNPNLSTKEPIRSSKLHKTITSISIIVMFYINGFDSDKALIYFDSHRFQFLHTDYIDYSYIYIPQFPSSHLVFLATVQTRPRARRRSTKGDRRWRARRHTPHRPRLPGNHSKVRPAILICDRSCDGLASSKNGKKRSECKNTHDKSPAKTSCWDKQVENAWLAMVHGCGAALTHCQWPIPWRA